MEVLRMTGFMYCRCKCASAIKLSGWESLRETYPSYQHAGEWNELWTYTNAHHRSHDTSVEESLHQH